MTLRQLKSAFKKIKECAGEEAASRVVIAAPLKKRRAEYRKLALQQIKQDNFEISDVRKRFKGYVPGAMVYLGDLVKKRASLEGDLCVMKVDGPRLRWTPAREYVREISVKPIGLRLSDAYVMDSDIGDTRDLDAVVTHLCETLGKSSRRR